MLSSLGPKHRLVCLYLGEVEIFSQLSDRLFQPAHVSLRFPKRHSDPLIPLSRNQPNSGKKADGEVTHRRLGILRSAMVVWLSGLPASGKTTLARAVLQNLRDLGYNAVLLDGDDFRRGLCADLGFTPEGRRENLRRAAEAACLLANQGLFVIAAFITPTAADRALILDTVSRRAPDTRLFQVFVDAPVEVCEARDPKGHYARARRGDIAEFTGVSAPFEPPTRVDLTVNTAVTPPAEAAEAVMRALAGALSASPPGATTG